MKLGLKGLRAERGLSQEEAAKGAGVTIHAIKMAERFPEKLSIKNAVAICTFYGVHLDDIFLPVNYAEREVCD